MEKTSITDLIAFNNSDKHPLKLYRQGEEGGKKFNSYFAETMDRIKNQPFSEEVKVMQVLDSIVLKLLSEETQNKIVIIFLDDIYNNRLNWVFKSTDAQERTYTKVYESHFGPTE